MRPALGKERKEEPAENHENTAAPLEPELEDHPNAWDSPGSIEQFESRSREDIAGFEFEGYPWSDAVPFE